MTGQIASHGRGGAGNMARASQTPQFSDLTTPSLKSSFVTTGRGGSGNMARNVDPLETRLRQDVEAIPRRRSSGAQHAGRGGAGNVFRAEDIEEELSRRHSNNSSSGDSAVSDDQYESVSVANKGKHWIFGKRA